MLAEVINSYVHDCASDEVMAGYCTDEIITPG
jgi:hypothetical protein